MHTRRHFIQTGLGGALGLSLMPTLSLAAATSKAQVAFQLYTVRGECARDLPNTLKTLAEIGYTAVEFWGYGGTKEVYQKYTAPDLKKLLDDTGLKCCGMHLELKAIKENLERTIETNQTIGSEFLNVAAAQEKMSSEKGIAELADILNKAAAQCAPLKLTVGYHAHPFDFEKINGRFAWDLLFSQAQPAVNMQMDVGNCLAGNGDPIAMLKKFPGRTRSIHIKEHQDKTFASPYYKEVFELCETQHPLKWYIIEMGSMLGTGFDVPREALKKFKARAA